MMTWRKASLDGWGCRRGGRQGRQGKYGSGKTFLERHLNWNLSEKEPRSERLPGRGYNKCKVPEAGIHLACSVKVKKTFGVVIQRSSVTRGMWVR